MVSTFQLEWHILSDFAKENTHGSLFTRGRAATQGAELLLQGVGRHEAQRLGGFLNFVGTKPLQERDLLQYDADHRYVVTCHPAARAAKGPTLDRGAVDVASKQGLFEVLELTPCSQKTWAHRQPKLTGGGAGCHASAGGAQKGGAPTVGTGKTNCRAPGSNKWPNSGETIAKRSVRDAPSGVA